jgi:hypothetical protein
MLKHPNACRFYWGLALLLAAVLSVLSVRYARKSAEPPAIEVTSAGEGRERQPVVNQGSGRRNGSQTVVIYPPAIGERYDIMPLNGPPPLVALRELKAAAGGNYGKFEGAAWNYIQEALARGSGDDGDKLFNAIQEVTGPGTTRAFLLAWYFSNIKESDFPKLPRLLQAAALDEREMDQYRTGLRGNIHGMMKDFDGYYEFAKMVDSITGVAGVGDPTLVTKFSEKAAKLPESERRKQVDALLSGDKMDRYIGFEYLRQQDLKTANELLGDSKLPDEVRDELAEAWIPAMAGQSPATALEMVARLNTGSGKREALEAEIVEKWVNEVEDPARKKAFSLVIAKYLRRVGATADAEAWEKAANP